MVRDVVRQHHQARRQDHRPVQQHRSPRRAPVIRPAASHFAMVLDEAADEAASGDALLMWSNHSCHHTPLPGASSNWLWLPSGQPFKVCEVTPLNAGAEAGQRAAHRRGVAGARRGGASLHRAGLGVRLQGLGLAGLTERVHFSDSQTWAL